MILHKNQNKPNIQVGDKVPQHSANAPLLPLLLALLYTPLVLLSTFDTHKSFSCASHQAAKLSSDTAVSVTCTKQ